MLQRVFIEETSRVPVTKRTQVLVVGGGTSGVPAAIAARRCGADVLLVERDLSLGGTSTLSMMNLFGGPYEHSHGLMKEVIDRLAESGDAFPGPLTPFDGQAYQRLLFELTQGAGVELLLDTWFSRAVVEDGRVKGIIVENKGGRQAILADAVIDATGDGDVAASAGASAIVGRTSDGKMRPITLLFRLGNIDVDTLTSWAKAHPEEFKQDSNSHIIDDTKGLYRLHGFFGLIAAGRDRGELDSECHYLRFEYVWPGRRTALVNTTRVYNVNGLKAEDLTRAVLEGRKQVDLLYKFIQREVPGCQDAFLVDVAPRLGVRETRHIVGDYLLTEKDLVQDRDFPDTVVRDFRRVVPGAAVHSPDGKEGTPEDLLERGQVRQLRSFNIPYRCLLPRGLNGLLVAGRCISADHQADGWTRDIPGCTLVGQAAGVAAAIAVKERVELRRVDLGKVRHELERQGVITGKE